MITSTISVTAKNHQNSIVTQFEVYGAMILDDSQDKKSLLRKILRDLRKNTYRKIPKELETFQSLEIDDEGT